MCLPSRICWNAEPKKVIALYAKGAYLFVTGLSNETSCFRVRHPEYFGTRIARGKPPELTGKAKYVQRSIVNKYREGKVKSTPERGVKEN